jgi:hypothetical protein
MTRHSYRTVCKFVRALRPSPESVAGAAAIYDPELMLELKASRRWRAVSSERSRPASASRGRA